MTHPLAGVVGEMNRYARARIESTGGKPPGGGSRRLAAVALVLLVVLQATAPIAAAAASTTAPPSGMVGVPNAAVTDKIPDYAQGKIPEASAFRGSVMTDANADTLAVEVTTRAAAQGRASACNPMGANSPPFCENPVLALNISDDVNHDGRRVAVPKDVLDDALGYEPTSAHVAHESGEEYAVQVRERGSLYVFSVAEFSTNTVTFSGTVSLSGNPATDGATYQYEINDLDAASNFTIDLTGTLATENDTESASGLSNGGSLAVSVAGSDDAINDEITVTGGPESNQSHYTGSASSKYLAGDAGNYNLNSAVQFDNPPGAVNGIWVYIASSSSPGSVTTDVYIDKQAADGQYTEGTKVMTGYTGFPSTTGWHFIEFPSAYDTGGAAQISVNFVDNGQSPDNAYIYVGEDGGSAGYFYNNNYGSLGTASAKLTAYANGVTVSSVADSASLGTLKPGATQTVAYNLTTSTSSLDVSASSGTIDLSAAYTEQQASADPSIEVNGHWTNYTGTLGDGATATLTTNTSWLQSGPNRVNVSLTSPSVDAPTPAVVFDYSHDATDDTTVEYAGETWSERYNVSRTWGSGRSGASLTIPFEGDVVSNRELQVYINGTETPPAYSEFSGTTLEVGLGNLDPGTTTRVVAAGSKVVVSNGSIQVLEPTTQGNDLSTKFEITSKSAGFRIDVSGTASADRVHYLANTSYTPENAYVSVENGGSSQYLYAPNASAGSTATARTLPLSVNPQNDVELVVEDETEPKFRVRPGDVAGDSVDLTYYNTESGVTYALYDVDNDKIVKRDTAQSPVYFSLDSDESGLFSIIVSESTGSSGGGGGGGGSARERVTDVANDPLANPIIMVVVAAAVILVGAYVASKTGLSFKIVGAVGVLVAGFTLETIQPGTISGPVAGFLASAEEVGPVLWLIAGIMALLTVYGLYSRYGKPPQIVLQGGR